MRRLAIVAILLLVPVAAACGGPSAGGLAGKSAEQVIQLAQAAAKQKGSFHFVDQTGTGSDAQILTGDVSGTDTEEQVKGPNGTLEVRLEGSTIYVQASTLVLENALKLPASVASSEAGKWISLLTTDVPYQTAAKALEPTAEVAPYIPAGDLKIGSVTTLRGENVLAVSGTASTAAKARRSPPCTSRRPRRSSRLAHRSRAQERRRARARLSPSLHGARPFTLQYLQVRSRTPP